jgi:hypothetical protein
MKIKAVIFIFFSWITCMGQSVPNTTTFTLQDVANVVGYNNLSACFTNSDAAKFDATYGSKTMNPKTLYGFRNYGAACTRPGGLTNYYVVYQVSGNNINNATDALYWATNFNCSPNCLYYQGKLSSVADGTDVYLGFTDTNCTKVNDGYYVLELYGAPWTTWAIQIISGKMYLIIA